MIFAGTALILSLLFIGMRSFFDQDSKIFDVSLDLISGLILLGSYFVIGRRIDQFYVGRVSKKHGIDPYKIRWHDRVKGSGNPFCPRCESIFLLPPQSLNRLDMVQCGDCGEDIVEFGEFRDFVDKHNSG